MSESKIPTTSIHGNRYRHQRELAMSQFESGEMSAIIVTDVKFREAGEWFSFLFILLRETDTFIKHLFHSRSTPYY